MATFTDANPDADLADYSATVDWGDGQGGPGTIVDNGDGTFSATGSHLYAEEGNYTIRVSILDAGGSGASAADTAVVADPPVTLSGGVAVRAIAGSAFPAQSLATFTDPGGAEGLGDYLATLDWGDGSAPAAAAISFDPTGGVFTIHPGQPQLRRPWPLHHHDHRRP